MSRWRRAAAVGAVLALGNAWAAVLPRVERERLAREAREAYDREDYPTARAKWTEALNAGAPREERRRWRPWIGRSYEAEANYQKALTVYREAHEEDPRNADRWVDLARLYDTVGLDDLATEHYERVLRRDPNRRDAALALARISLEAGRAEQARDLAAAVVRRDPENLGAQALLAEIEERTGDLAAAARRREGLLNRRPSGEGYMALGRLWSRQEAYAAADLAFARAEKAGGESPDISFERAALAWREGDALQTRFYLTEALNRDAGYYPARFLAALAEWEDGRPAAARDHLRSAFPPDATAERLGRILEDALRGRRSGEDE